MIRLEIITRDNFQILVISDEIHVIAVNVGFMVLLIAHRVIYIVRNAQRFSENESVRVSQSVLTVSFANRDKLSCGYYHRYFVARVTSQEIGPFFTRQDARSFCAVSVLAPGVFCWTSMTANCARNHESIVL